MSYVEDILELAKDETPAVRAALERAVQVLENDDGPHPEEATQTLVKLGLVAASGNVGPQLLVEGVAALLTICRTIQQEEQLRTRQSMKKGTAAGLSARIASRKSSAQGQARGAAAAWGKSRRRNNP